MLRAGLDHPPLGDGPGVHHVGVYDDAGDAERLLGTGNIRLESRSLSETLWRIRGMATEPDHQGHGVGSRVLEALVEHARTHGGGGVALHARTTARDFYERHGFRVDGEAWDEPEIGPHVRMIRST